MSRITLRKVKWLAEKCDNFSLSVTESNMYKIKVMLHCHDTFKMFLELPYDCSQHSVTMVLQGREIVNIEKCDVNKAGSN
jgi:hypothetical protein